MLGDGLRRKGREVLIPADGDSGRSWIGGIDGVYEGVESDTFDLHAYGREFREVLVSLKLAGDLREACEVGTREEDAGLLFAGGVDGEDLEVGGRVALGRGRGFIVLLAV